MSLRLKNRTIRRSIQRETSRKTETRDAILWDVDTANRYCRIKIQGSNTLIKAFYPENWEQTPFWLKPGNSVRIMHTGGNRNRIELVGQGQYIPTPTGAAMFPTLPAGVDAVLSDGKVKAFPDTKDRKVYIETGTYRISDVVYTLGPMDMSESNIIDMSSGIPFGTTAAVLSFDAASSTLFRFDIIVVGADGVIDIIKGTSATVPLRPDTPSSHVLLGWVLLYPGLTEITQDDINKPYAPPFAAEIRVEVADDRLGYEQESTEEPVWDETTDITVSVRDQYGNLVTGTNWGVLIEFLQGDGQIEEAEPPMTLYLGTDATRTFTYTRDDPEFDESPIIQFSLVQDPEMIGMSTIILYGP